MSTISDVAELAKVSSATVSRVLNGGESVKLTTRIKVLDAIKKLNYQPNHFSRGLRLQRSNMFLILMPNISSPSYGNILRGMDDEATQHGYSLLIVDTQMMLQRELQYIRMLETKMVDGAVFLKPLIDAKSILSLSQRFPIAQCCEYYLDCDVTHVSIDNFEAAYAAVHYLISIGHKRIALLSSTNGATSTILRERAYRKALSDAGFPYDESLVKRGSYLFDSGIQMTRELLGLEDRPTAIFAISDAVATGSMRAVLDAGLSIPSDMAIMGFDNTDFSRMLNPPLSTISQPLYDIGRATISALMAAIEGEPYEKEVILPYEIILRGSTN